MKVMTLEINGIEVECVIGDLPEERERLQKLLVDLELELPDDVVETDALEDTVDYVEIAAEVRATLVAAKCRMIERAAFLAAKAAGKDPRIKSVRARVVKSGAVPGIKNASAICKL